MDAFAETADVTAVSLPISSQQKAVVQGLLDQASTILRGWGIERGVNIDELIDADALRTELVKVAVVNAVKRVLPNLDGAIESTVAIDDFRRTLRRSEKQLADGIYFTATDLRGILPARRSRFGTLRMGSAL